MKIDINKIQRVTWTGGTTPESYRNATSLERKLTCRFFREDIEPIKNWFLTAPDVASDIPGKAGVLDYARVLWGRAKHDAHATVRAQLKTRQVNKFRIWAGTCEHIGVFVDNQEIGGIWIKRRYRRVEVLTATQSSCVLGRNVKWLLNMVL
jgi:hypothetical protein